LIDLAAQSGETANLVVRHGPEAVYIDHVIGTRDVKLFTTIGQTVPLHCTAVGKVLLAFSAPDTCHTLLAGLRLARHTPNTITSVRALRRELEAIRGTGYAVDREEHERGVACIAAPVCDVMAAAVGAIGISGPAGRVLAELGSLARKVAGSAAAASRSLGCADTRLPPAAIQRLEPARPERR
jgi:IclR family acetate operon transcriptional repressor